MLGKRKLYELACEKLKNYVIPKCKDCSYVKFGKYERIKFYTSDYEVVSFTSWLCGKWYHLVVRDFDDVVITDSVMLG